MSEANEPPQNETPSGSTEQVHAPESPSAPGASKKWQDRAGELGEKLKAAASRVRESAGPWLTQVGERAQPLFQRAREKAAQWRLREKISAALPQDLVKSFPRNFDPIALAEWSSQAFQKDAVSFYGRALTLFLCAWFLADATGIWVERFIPEPPAPRQMRAGTGIQRLRSVDVYDVIASRNLFSSTNKQPGDGAPSTTPQDQGPPQKTSLPFNLVGTLIMRDEIKSIATIEDKAASMVYPLRVEDEIPAKARILKIEPRRVIFLNTSSNRREYVELPEDLTLKTQIGISPPTGSGAKSGVEQVSPNHFNIAKTTVDRTLSDFNKVLTEARAVPNFENGTPAGYKLFQIVPGSIFDALGLKNGDTIMAINGQSINDPAKAFEMLNELKGGARNFEITMKRDGRPMTNNYDIR